MSRLLTSAVLVALIVCSIGQPAAADAPIKVGNGTAASCSEAAFRQALGVADALGGGLISFRCGPGPVTIPITETVTIPNQTTVDGGNLITLQAAPPDFLYLYNVIDVEPNSTVELRRVSLVLGWQVVFNQGDLTVRHSTIGGGFIHSLTNVSGTLTVVDSVIRGDIWDMIGGGILNESGILIVRNSTFPTGLGSGIGNGGTATIDGSTFTNNQWQEGYGGAISNWGTMTITHSTFADNLAYSLGGAIDNQGTLTVRSSTFTGNVAVWGGGISNRGELTVINSEITGNTALIEGGGIYTCCGGTTTLIRTTITGNTPDDSFPVQ
jgi:hypothetical protein